MIWSLINKNSNYAFKSARCLGLVQTYKCTFMVFLGMILGFIISKEGKLLDPKKI